MDKFYTLHVTREAMRRAAEITLPTFGPKEQAERYLKALLTLDPDRLLYKRVNFTYSREGFIPTEVLAVHGKTGSFWLCRPWRDVPDDIPVPGEDMQLIGQWQQVFDVLFEEYPYLEEENPFWLARLLFSDIDLTQTVRGIDNRVEAANALSTIKVRRLGDCPDRRHYGQLMSTMRSYIVDSEYYLNYHNPFNAARLDSYREAGAKGCPIRFE